MYNWSKSECCDKYYFTLWEFLSHWPHSCETTKINFSLYSKPFSPILRSSSSMTNKHLVTATQLQWWDFLLVSYQLDPETIDTAHANLCTGSAAVLLVASPPRPDVPLWAGSKRFTVERKKISPLTYAALYISIWQNWDPLNFHFAEKLR